MSLIPLPYKLLGLALLVIALAGAFLGYGHRQYVKGGNDRAAVDQVAIDKIKLESANTLIAETAKTRAVEQALQMLKDKQELQDADHQKTIADLSARLRAAAGPALRLRDPNATPGCRLGSGGAQSQPTSPTDTGPADTAETGGLLSVQLSDLSTRLMREADEINAAYQSCRAYAAAVAEASK